MDSLDNHFLSLTLTLAHKGNGMVSPNPMVGCVLVRDGRIIGEGYHRKFGGAHAEVDAIKSADVDLTGATMYVSLEPCSHFGKTPPCTDLIIENRIKRVVIGTLDPNPIVSGNGIKKLLDAGIAVEVDKSQKYGIFYRKFATYISSDLPYITIKSAITLDGNVAENSGHSKWITTEKSRHVVEKLRNEHDAILTTSRTVRLDNPRLTLRNINGVQPKRLLLTSNLFFDEKLNFFRNTDGKSVVITSDDSLQDSQTSENLKKAGIPVIFVQKKDELNHPDPQEALKMIRNEGTTSVLVEAGAQFVSTLLNKNLFNEFILFVSPKLMGDGINLFSGINNFGLDNSLQLKLKKVKKIDKDAILYFERMER